MSYPILTLEFQLEMQKGTDRIRPCPRDFLTYFSELAPLCFI